MTHGSPRARAISVCGTLLMLGHILGSPLSGNLLTPGSVAAATSLVSPPANPTSQPFVAHRKASPIRRGQHCFN
jgi:hypothetical protein